AEEWASGGHFGFQGIQNHSGEFPGRVFLKEMASAQGNVRLAICPWNATLLVAVTAPGDRIAVAEAGNERLAPFLQDTPPLPCGSFRRVVQCTLYQSATRPGTGFVFIAGERSVVGSQLQLVQCSLGAQLNDPADRKPWAVACKGFPHFERCRHSGFAGGQHAVADNDSAKASMVFSR